jgi:hypothetical protein
MHSQAIRDILSDLLAGRRDRQCERIKKPPKNTFTVRNPATPGHPAKSATRPR